MMAEIPEELTEITRYFPEFWAETGHLLTKTLYEHSHLDRKTIELILLGMLAVKRWRTGVEVHAQVALDHGATPAEVRGALLLSFAVGGNSAALPALHWAEPVLAKAAAAAKG
jgi:alkylhydroperoxidase/carboxymuconolactone decarboxylase family protein YurZ